MADQKVTIEVNGRAWDCPATKYSTDEEDHIVGVEITDMDGLLQTPRVAVFCQSGLDGTKAFLTPDQARCLAGQIRMSADAIDAGHRTLVQH